MSTNKVLNRHLRLITNAIFSGKLPDCAIEWPIVEDVRTSIIRGSGESTTWISGRTIRENGKQTARDVGYGCENMELPDSLAYVGKHRHVIVYLRIPPFIVACE